MKKFFTKILMVFGFGMGILFPVSAENFSWDFADCEIKDVLFAVSLDTGISITADDTVKGKCDFKFSGNDFEKAFDSFLVSARLYAEKKDDIWNVSRCYIEKSEELFSVDAVDILPRLFLEKLSVALNLCITYDSLPEREISIHLKNKTPEEILLYTCRFFGNYSVEDTGNGWHISKSTSGKTTGTGINVEVKNEGEKYNVNIKNASFSEVLEKLFADSKKGFCVLGNSDVKNVRTSFSADSFEECLGKICNQNGFSFLKNKEIYYIYSDTSAKNETLYGKRSWTKFNLKYIEASKVIPAVSKITGNVETLTSNDMFEFFANVTESEKEIIKDFISSIDLEKKTYLVNLKNIKSADFISRLPPFLEKKNISDAEGIYSFYFTGTEEAYKKLMEEVNIADKEIPRLKYDLLILQYDETKDNNWANSFSARSLHLGDRTSVQAQLGSVMGFNLNVVSAFGLDFADALQTSINENKTNVFADTTLYGVSGKPITFSNTNTYRYRDNNLDPETGKPVYSGVTREIVSGLKLEVLGFASDEGKITSTVKASVTRRGTDSSSITGNPPPTTEKNVTTEVVGYSGEPVVLSGLVQNSETEEEKRTPFLSKIPLIGYLFKNRKKTVEKTQMVIYLVPYLEGEERIKTETDYSEEWMEKRKEGLCRILNSD